MIDDPVIDGPMIDPPPSPSRFMDRNFLRELLQYQYTVKFLRELEIWKVSTRWPIPDPSPFGPRPQSGFSMDARDALLGDLVISALGDPTPQPSRPSFVNEIRESGIHLEVVKDLAARFEAGAKALREEQAVFEQAGPC